MKELEYIEASDLAKLRTVQAILKDCMCMDDPNKTRLKSMQADCHLMVDSLFESVTISVEDEEG